MFERMIYKDMFECFAANKVIKPNQLVFKPKDFCINQLLPSTYKIYQSFHNGFEIHGVSWHILVYSKVWHNSLIFKLSHHRMYENRQPVKGFLKNYKQRAVLNGQASSWAVPAGAP